ncbi:MAG: DUF1192 domain-containing protein [Alphaproteobacteria bacterium]|nr:DUF1192 domain-containing protein [Alphaproteobacteria bacterium]
MFDEDLEPRTVKPQPKNLEKMSIDELERYIADMEGEIDRVREEIKRKVAHRDAASSLFRA